MNFDALFNAQLDALKQEGNYRYFAELERKCGKFPLCANHVDGEQRDVTVWCSNDYLGMGQNPIVIDAMVDAKTERIAEKVESGRITQEQADEKLAELEDKISDRVNGVDDYASEDDAAEA